MELYNTLSEQLEPFVPLREPVSVYVCGITPYDTTHLGHAFTYTTFDILIRYLEFLGNSVRYVENVTDIDDDILRRAKQVDEDWVELGNRWTAHFIRDMISLNVRPPDYYTRATDFIPEIITTVEKLLAADVAYVSDGSVYYDVEKWPDFGQLSHIPRAEMLPVANERGNNPDDPRKRHPLDFVLWQAQAAGEPAWDSPWGRGRPGWHIECSTMSTDLLGPTVDIHGGGGDLVFPHHECEIAQAEPATGRRPFVRLWMHVAMVHHDGAKMSKSLGNLVMVRDLLKTYSADALRLYLGCHHYRESWSFEDEEMEKREQFASRLREAVTARGGSRQPLDPAGARAAFIAAMDADLDTHTALGELNDLAGETLEAAQAGRDVGDAQEAIRTMSRVFGLRLDAHGPSPRVVEGWERHLARFEAP